MTDDFWPDDIAESNLVTPVSILKQQGALLGEKTKQLVTGEVKTDANGEVFIHTFFIVSPTLSYKFALFDIVHGIAFYPLTLRQGGRSNVITEEEHFKKRLMDIFMSQHTRNIVHSLLAQVRS